MVAALAVTVLALLGMAGSADSDPRATEGWRRFFQVINVGAGILRSQDDNGNAPANTAPAQPTSADTKGTPDNPCPPNGDDPLPKPSVSNQKLQNYVNDLYKGTTNPNRVGTGTTADAVRNELKTNKPSGNKWHSDKAKQYINGLQNWLKNNPNATYGDRLVAQSLLDDLKDSLKGCPP